jgi:hypothetical protein
METTGPKNWQVGEAVYYSREPKLLGIVYATYERGTTRPGVQVLLSNGKDLSGFSAEEADQFFQPLGDTDLDYDFQSVSWLAKDFRDGKFSQAFHNARVLHMIFTLCCHQ